MKGKKVYKYALVVNANLEKPLKEKALSLNLSVNQLIELALNHYLSSTAGQVNILLNEKIKP